MTRRARAFAACNARRLLKDPISLFFGIAFPVILLALMHLVQTSVPDSPRMFELPSLAPGMCLFGLSFLALLTGQIVARDRSSAFLSRLAASPMTAADFIWGYLLPMLPFALVQVMGCMVFAALFGLAWSWGMLAAAFALLPSAFLFIGIGILAGTLLTEGQVGGICGGILVSAVAWLAGLFMPMDLVGGAYRDLAYALPFVHGANAAKAALSLDWPAVWPDMGIVAIWATGLLIVSICVFHRRLVQR